MVYIVFLTFIYSFISNKSIGFIKYMLYWIAIVGIPLYLRTLKRKYDCNYINEFFSDSIKFTILLTVIISPITFQFIKEIIFVPIAILVFIISIVDNNDIINFSQKPYLYKNIFCLAILIALIFISEYKSYIAGIYIMPFYYTLLVFLFVYIKAVYNKYIDLLKKMRVNDITKVRQRIKLKNSLVWIYVSYNRACNFEKNNYENMYAILNEIKIIDNIKKRINKYYKKLKNSDLKYAIIWVSMLFLLYLVVKLNSTFIYYWSFVMIIFICISIFEKIKNGIITCTLFLFFSLMIGFFLFYNLTFIVPSINIQIGDIGFFMRLGIYTIIHFIIIIYVCIKADSNIVKISILLTITILSIVYAVSSLLINLLPLSTLNDNIIWFFKYTAVDIDYYYKNYDARSFLNGIIQLMTYPLYINLLISAAFVEVRQYLSNKKVKGIHKSE